MTKFSKLDPFPPSHEEWNPSLEEWQSVVRESIMNSLGEYFRSSLQDVRKQHYKAIQFFEIFLNRNFRAKQSIHQLLYS